MNLLDIFIIGAIILGAVMGFKRGFTRQLVSTVGFIAIVVIAFMFKGNVSTFFYEHLPFFKFGGWFKGITALNILMYETIAFFVLLAVLGILLRVLMLATSIFEKILNATVILGIPSKFAGAVVGLVGNFVFVFIVLYLISMPTFSYDWIEESKYAEPILKETPFLSGLSEESVIVADELNKIKENYKEEETNQFNLETIDIMLKYNIVTVETLDSLIEKGKLQLDNIESIIRKYR